MTTKWAIQRPKATLIANCNHKLINGLPPFMFLGELAFVARAAATIVPTDVVRTLRAVAIFGDPTAAVNVKDSSKSGENKFIPRLPFTAHPSEAFHLRKENSSKCQTSQASQIHYPTFNFVWKIYISSQFEDRDTLTSSYDDDSTLNESRTNETAAIETLQNLDSKRLNFVIDSDPPSKHQTHRNILSNQFESSTFSLWVSW